MVLVYIAEAHASDEWPINSTRLGGPGNALAQHKTLEDRRAAARRLRAALPCLANVETHLDGMDDAHMRAYAAWPTRMHGVRDGRVEHIVHPRGGQFDLASLRDWLLRACAK